MMVLLFALALAGSAFATRSEHELPATRSLVRGATEVLFDEPGDGALYAVGRNWKARFASDAVSFVPFLGSDAPRDEIVRFVLASVRVGGELLELRTDVAPIRDGESIRYARGAVD